MPLIPLAVDTTPLIPPPPPVTTTVTYAGGAGGAPPRSTESGTAALARALAATAMPLWSPLTLLDVPSPAATIISTYDTETLPARVAEPVAESAAAPAASTTGERAYAAFKDLGRWLMLDDTAVARMVGIKRTTPYAWERQGSEPRPATVRRLLQHHAVVAAVVDRLGETDAQAWLAAGSPSRIELLLDGRLDAIDEQVGELVFARSAASPPSGGYVPEADDDRPPSQIAAERG
jgi:hypothetical protein